MKHPLAIGLLLLGSTAAIAQATFTMPPPAGVMVIGAQVVEHCHNTDLTPGNAALVTMDMGGVLCSNSSSHPTYATGAVAYTGYATPTDFFAIQGSATKIIKIINIRLSGNATANNSIDVGLLKRSTANTSGTPTTLTPTSLDSTNSAATATVVSYGAAPTLGTLVGPLCACQVELPAKAGVGGYVLEWQFGRNGGGPVVLRGANEMAVLNAYGASFPAGTTLNITVTWTEQ